MRCCQLCGCTSWGPVGNRAELRTQIEFKGYEKDVEYVRCDNCKSIARKDLLETLGAYVDPPESPAPDAWDLGSMFAKVMPSMPAPPTRTERLTQTLVRRAQILDIYNNQLAVEIVRFARQLETALDNPAVTQIDPIANTPWLVLSFPAREEFERWVTGLFDTVNRDTGADKKDYTQETYEAAIRYATKQS